jgi:hypothetical protein
MAKKPETPDPGQSPFERFREASRVLFNLPKETVQKTLAKYPKTPTKRGKRRQSRDN